MQSHFFFSAKIIKGDGIGGKIGFPTINLDKIDLEIDHGVYLVKIEIDNKTYKGLLHFGPKKTFDNNISLELFIEDFISDIKNKLIKIIVIKKIRDIKKFANIKSLQNQIKQDLRSY